jgi:hypothetical protein
MPQTTPNIEQAEPKYRCRHILTDGHRCLSPCLRGEEFCYYHHTTRRPVANPRQRRSRRSAFELPNPEDRAAIQSSIGEVLRRIAANDIDPRRAGLLLYGLQIASSNLPKAKFAPASSGEDSTERDTYAGNAPNTVEEIVLDPTLGILAPRTQYSQDRPKGYIGLLLDHLDQQFPDSQEDQPEDDEDDATIPTLHAKATSRVASEVTQGRVPHISTLRCGHSRHARTPLLPTAVTCPAKSTPNPKLLKTLRNRQRVPYRKAANRKTSAADSGVISRCGPPSSSNPTINLRIVADRSKGG